MKLCVICHMYPYKDKGLAGGELYLHHTIKALIKLGMEIDVYNLVTEWRECTIGRPDEWEYEGVKVNIINSLHNMSLDYDGYITHLAAAEAAMAWCITNKKQCYFIAHNTHDYPIVRFTANTDKPIKVIYNSEFVKGRCNYPNASFVWTPPINIDHWALKRDPYYNKYITLVNPLKDKGAEQFKRLAQLVPHRQFLIVKGGYYPDLQITEGYPKNVTLIEPQTDMRGVYGCTRILIYMSIHESYGMCGQEAQAAGIPVLAHANPQTLGLVENLGDAGMYVWDNVDNMLGYIEVINLLDDHYEYLKWSMRSRKNTLDKDTDLRAPALKDFFELF